VASKPRRTPRLAPTERRAQLVQAALRAFARRGYAATQVRDVVREAAVARATFYLHFESKRHLLTAVAREIVDRLPARAPAPAPPRTRVDLEASLAALHRSVLEGLAASRDAARLVFADGAAAEPSVARALAAHDQAWRRLVAGVLSRARDAGCLRPGVDVAFATEAVLGSVQRVVRTRLLKDPKADPAALAAALARLHAASLCPDGD
jgi:TetR/AcrR family fatty acid metabolism transcriptional regulator